MNAEVKMKYREFSDVESSMFYEEPNEPYKFKIYMVEDFIEAGFSCRTNILGYFENKQKAIDFINSDEIKYEGQLSISPLHVR